MPEYKDFVEHYKKAIQNWGSWLAQALDDIRFYKNQQWTDQELAYLRSQRREALVFNKVRRIINIITGFQRKNRLGFRVDGEDPELASQYTGLLMYVMQKCNGFHAMSDAFESALKTGLGLVEFGIDFSNDPINGDIVISRVPINSFVLDPSISKTDLSDCKYVLRRSWVTKEEAMSLFPKQSDMIAEMKPKGSDDLFLQAIVPFYRDKFKLDEFWYKEQEEKTVLYDPHTGKWRYWPKEHEDKLRLLLQQFPHLQVRKVYRSVTKLASFLDGELVYDGPNPLGIEDFPFVAIFFEFDPEIPEFERKCVGLIRILRDPQRELNKRVSKMLDIIDSQIASGWIAEEGAVISPEQLFQTGQGQVVFAREGAVSGGKIRRLEPPTIPAGLFQLSQELDQALIEVAGVNNELFGTPENENLQIAGFLAKLRQAAGLTTLQKFFDQYRLSKITLGRKLLHAIQATFPYQKVQQILNEPIHPAFYDTQLLNYTVDVTESVLSDSQRQMYYRELVALKAMGAPIPWSALVEAAPIEKRQKLLEAVANEEKRLQQQMLIQQQLEIARVQADLAERYLRAMRAEKEQAAAVKNLAQAELARAKAISEIYGIPREELKALGQLLAIQKRKVTRR